jgi:hypothetical protein
METAKFGYEYSVDSVGKHGKFSFNMPDENEKPVSLIDIGQKLVGHSKAADFTANRGLVTELFPFIFEASERMSTRAISRFFEEEQDIKLSYVTIGKALNDPKQSWLSYFDSIEPAAITIAKWFRPASFKYLYVSKSDFDTRMNFEKEGMIGSAVARGALALLRPDRAAAVKLLREKWIMIGLGTRLKAKSYLEEHLMALADKF